MNFMSKGAITAAVLVFAVVLAFGLVATSPQAQQVEPEAVATAVRIQQISKQAVRLKIRSQGTVTPRTESILIAEVAGKVRWVSPNLVAGGYFKAGEVLLKLDPTDLQASLARNAAALARAQAEAEHSAYEHTRLQQLVKNKLTSQSSLESGLRAKRVSDAALQEAKIALQQAQRDLDRSQISAPYNGLVRAKSVDVGQYISRGNTLANIYASDEMEVRVPLADSQLSFLALPLGQRGELPIAQQANVTISTHYGGQFYQWPGKLVRTEAEIDTRTRMVNAVVRVKTNTNSELPPLPVGLFVHVEIDGRLAEEVVVLPRAVLRNQNQVLVVDQDNRLRYRDVELLRFDRDDVIISSGLETGERVNLSPIQTVIDGMHVKPIVTAATL